MCKFHTGTVVRDYMCITSASGFSSYYHHSDKLGTRSKHISYPTIFILFISWVVFGMMT